MGADGYRKDDRLGFQEILAFWQRDNFPPDVRLKDADIAKLRAFLAEQEAIPEKERGYLKLYSRRESDSPKAPAVKLLYRPVQPKAAPSGSDW